MSLFCIAVDDEKVILEELCSFLEDAEVNVEGAYRDPYEALDAVKKIKPDAAFLDIEMPGINGIELAKKIGKVSPQTQIVFVTAYENYALKAFEVSAAHYLLKPLTQGKLDEAITRVKRVKKMNEKKNESGIPAFLNLKKETTERISIKDRDNVYIIKIPEIIYIKTDEGKTVLVTKNGSYSIRSGLSFWEKKLEGYEFIRCHRSYIVNSSYITRMIHVLGEYKELVLDYCDINIPISRTKINDIKEWLGMI